MTTTTPLFDGATFNEARDGARLGEQSRVVFALMADGNYRTPEIMEQETGYSWASISARLRDFRKAKFGGHQVVRNYLGNGLFAYRLIVNQESPP